MPEIWTVVDFCTAMISLIPFDDNVFSEVGAGKFALILLLGVTVVGASREGEGTGEERGTVSPLSSLLLSWDRVWDRSTGFEETPRACCFLRLRRRIARTSSSEAESSLPSRSSSVMLVSRERCWRLAPLLGSANASGSGMLVAAPSRIVKRARNNHTRIQI